MLISNVSTSVVDAGDRDWVFVRVEADEPSLVGWGEPSLGWHTRAVCGAVQDLEPLVVGRGPPARRASVGDDGPRALLQGRDRRDERGLWDRPGALGHQGKALGVSLFELLGGPVRDRVRTYVNLGSELGGDARDPSAWSDAARAAREAGFDAMKVCPVAPARQLEGSWLVRETEKLVAAVREAAGDDADIMVDLYGRTSQGTAIQVGRALEPYRSWFLEEPCQPSNADGRPRWRGPSRSRSRPASDSSPATSSRSSSTSARAQSSSRTSATAAASPRSAGSRRWPRPPSSRWPRTTRAGRGTVVSIHVALVLPNFLILEQVCDDVPWRREIVGGVLETENGYVRPPTRPGIGLELAEEVAAAHRGTSPPPHLQVGPGGALLDW